jgi:1,4-dihydroxy-2-naphthoate octaprenyltransferase
LSRQRGQILNELHGHLRYRLGELGVWLGIPTAGLFIATPVSFSARSVAFYIATAFLMWHVLLFNDWGGAQRNPGEKRRWGRTGNAVGNHDVFLLGAGVTFVMFMGLYAALSWKLALLGLIAALTSGVYSHPDVHLKEHWLGAMAIHLVGGEVKFLLGYVVSSDAPLRGVLIGLFFALVFGAGHLVHQCIDRSEDLTGRLTTAATRFGVRPVVAVAVSLFFLGHLYVLALGASGVLDWATALVFVVPVPVHLLASIRLLQGREVGEAMLRSYRARYRMLFGLAVCALVFWRIMHASYGGPGWHR